jgi:acetyl esterase/lipase
MSRLLMLAGRCGGRLAAVVLVVLATGPVMGAESKGDSMSYGEACQFLSKHTTLLELSDSRGARVAVCPQWQGRVMTSTCDGPAGPSFGFINREFIEAGQPNPHFANYGAEDRMWLSPEGGPFSLWFKPGAEQKLANWYTPPALNEGAFQVSSPPHSPTLRMSRRMHLQNASGTPFDLTATRDVRLLERADLAGLFGEPAVAAMIGPGVKMVGYETVNTITNQGPPMTKPRGLVSIWVLGMLNAGPENVVIVPYRPGEEADLGPVVKSDYFGPVPPERLKITPQAILFRADGHYRAKLGTSQKRARNLLGSINYADGVLTLVQFTMSEDPGRQDYLNNMWQVPQAKPYVGDVANTYNDGPPEPGKKGLGPFYEIESLSPARALGTGESLVHRHRTLHIQADPATLARLAKEILGVDLATVRRQMLGKRGQNDLINSSDPFSLPFSLRIWPGKAPGEKGDIGPEKVEPAPPNEIRPITRLANVSDPTITVHRPPKETANGTAVVICPGGGYYILATDLEGDEVADWLNSIGVTGIVLKYRVPARKDQPKHLAPLQDAQRALSLVRSRAAQWEINPARIGILGFSAGGHLAAAASTNFDRRQYEPIDGVDAISCRPDFAVLVYPAYLTAGDHLSPEIRVDEKTPPTFFVHAADDGISAENSIAMFMALRRAKVSAEVHVYAGGGHGFGLRPTKNPCCTWPNRCQEWMKSRGLLEKQP